MSSILKIAIVDDHPMTRNGVITTLASGPYEVVIEAGNGRELFDFLTTAESSPDICILDINMPHMNGYETAKKLRSEYPKVKVLAFSMLQMDYCIVKMIEYGAVGYLTKDGAPLETIEALESLRRYGYYHSEFVSAVLQEDMKEHIKKITDKEEAFLKLCSSDMTYKEIAADLGVSKRTVDGYRENLFAKFKIKSRTALALFAVGIGLIDFCHAVSAQRTDTNKFMNKAG